MMNDKLKTAMKKKSPTQGLDLIMIKSKEGGEKIIKNLENVYRILKHHPDFQGRIRLNVFKNTVEIYEESKWRQINDFDDIQFQRHLSVLFPFLLMVGKEMVHDAILAIAKECQYNPPKEYFEKLSWDGIPRLDTWLSSVYNVEKNAYHAAVGSNWLKGLVHRTIVPGCKFDYVIVLQGNQGIKKSTSLSALATPEWHLEMTESPDRKDFFEQMRGKLIIEFSEGESFTKTDVKKMKAVITTRIDTYRPSYGHYAEDFPRRCVFAMTTNQGEFLKDDTGNRRWLPVNCIDTANIEWLESNRDQLFAEAYQRVIILKESTWEFPEKETLEAQENARMKDPNTDIVAEWYSNLSDDTKRRGISIQRVYIEVLNRNMPGHKSINGYEMQQIAGILKLTLGLEKRRIMRIGYQLSLWFRPEDKRNPKIFDQTEIELANSTEEEFKNF